VIEAVRGEDGIGKCATESPDLAILDLGLPDLDGQDPADPRYISNEPGVGYRLLEGQS
jgi:hypothetical protein